MIFHHHSLIDEIFKQIDLSKYRPKSVRLEWVNLPLDIQDAITKNFDDNGYLYEIIAQDITAITKEHYDELLLAYPDESIESTTIDTPTNNTSNVTIVTGIWDIKSICINTYYYS